MKFTRRQDINSAILKYSSILWVACVVFLWQYFSAPMYDDIAYSRIVEDTVAQDFWDCKGDLIRDYSDVAKSVLNHHMLINGRLATNTLMFLLVPLPHWLSSAIIGLLAGLMFLTIYWFVGGINRTRLPSWIYWAVAALFWSWFPWYNSFVSQDFKVNYIFPSVLTLIYAKGFIFNDSNKRKGWLLLYAITAFVLGLSHEGFSLPAIVSSVVVCLLDKLKNRRRLLLTVFLILGSALCVFAPSTLMRLNQGSAEKGFFYDMDTFVLSAKILFIPIVISIFIWSLCCFKRGLSVFKDDTVRNPIIFWICSFVIGIAMAVVLNQTGRVYWCSLLSLLMADLIIIKVCGFKRNYNMISVTLALMCVLWSLFFIREVRRVGDNQKELLTTLTNRNDGIAYVNLIRQQDIPWWTLKMIHPYNVTSELWNGVFSYEKDRYPLIVPEDYRNKSFEEWPKIEGNNPFRGYDNHWYSRTPIPMGTCFKVTLGKKTPYGLPFKPVEKSVIIESKESFFSVTEHGDTLWISEFDFPYAAEILRVDY